MKALSMAKILIFPIVSSILLAAHFSRVNQDGHALLALLFPLILLIKRRWALKILQIFLVAGSIIWIERVAYLRSMRIAEGRPWVRLAAVLGVVALLTFLSAFLLENRRLHPLYHHKKEDRDVPYLPSLLAFLLTASLLIIVHFKVDPPILLLERFLPGSFGIEILALSLYAAFITERMLEPKKSPKVRGLIWIVFSVVFFGQFLLGIMGFEKFLMTGKLHLPIPATILAGPLFRGHGFFMLVLFASTVILAGSAWCSHLCYIGSWDFFASRSLKRPQSLPLWWRPARWCILMLIVFSALLFRLLGMNPAIAAGIAIVYGLLGLGFMLFLSRRNGVMSHCTIYCPIGLVADLLGRISPFRIRFTSACDECGACRYSCRSYALEKQNIQQKRPGLSCSLCGDCLSSCPKDALQYHFLGLSPRSARTVFIVLIISIHAVFLGVARL